MNEFLEKNYSIWLKIVNSKSFFHNKRTPSNQSNMREAEKFIHDCASYHSYAQILQSNKSHSKNASYIYSLLFFASYFFPIIEGRNSAENSTWGIKNHPTWWVEICYRVWLSEIHLTFYACMKLGMKWIAILLDYVSLRFHECLSYSGHKRWWKKLDFFLDFSSSRVQHIMRLNFSPLCLIHRFYLLSRKELCRNFAYFFFISTQPWLRSSIRKALLVVQAHVAYSSHEMKNRKINSIANQEWIVTVRKKTFSCHKNDDKRSIEFVPSTRTVPSSRRIAIWESYSLINLTSPLWH